MRRFACLVIAVLALSGCNDRPPTGTDPEPTPPAGPADNATAGFAKASFVLGVHGMHVLDASRYGAFPALGIDGLSGNCLEANVPAAEITAINATLTWEAETDTSNELRLVLIAPDVGRWVWDVEGPSPMAAAPDVTLLDGTSRFILAVQHPSGSTAASVAQEVLIEVAVAWTGDSEIVWDRPSCVATDA